MSITRVRVPWAWEDFYIVCVIWISFGGVRRGARSEREGEGEGRAIGSFALSLPSFSFLSLVSPLLFISFFRRLFDLFSISFFSSSFLLCFLSFFMFSTPRHFRFSLFLSPSTILSSSLPSRPLFFFSYSLSSFVNRGTTLIADSVATATASNNNKSGVTIAITAASVAAKLSRTTVQPLAIQATRATQTTQANNSTQAIQATQATQETETQRKQRKQLKKLNPSNSRNSNSMQATQTFQATLLNGKKLNSNNANNSTPTTQTTQRNSNSSTQIKQTTQRKQLKTAQRKQRPATVHARRSLLLLLLLLPRRPEYCVFNSYFDLATCGDPSRGRWHGD